MKDFDVQIRKVEIFGGPYNYLKGFKFYNDKDECLLDTTTPKGTVTEHILTTQVTLLNEGERILGFKSRFYSHKPYIPTPEVLHDF